MINLSAIQILRNVVEHRVQLIHQRSHVHMAVQKGHRTYESIEVCEEKVIPREGNGPANEKKGETQPPESFTKVPQPNSRSLKGKSTLLLAISTFGYQILLYPHFAELCWVTSKLKEGPCADVSGPWRGWPFNSCIIRPNNSQDKVAISSSSGGIKSKEKPGLVRGLVAVGLSAYRGVYKSVREVSLDVRKVLEILIETINTKIQAGRNRYRYLRILSQVAYLEDMVNNWAYALLRYCYFSFLICMVVCFIYSFVHAWSLTVIPSIFQKKNSNSFHFSLEQDSPEPAAKVVPASVGSLNSHLICEGQQAEGEDCHLVVPVEGDDLATQETICMGIPAATIECLPLNDKHDNLDNLDRNGGNASLEGSLQNHSFPDNKHINNSSHVNQPLFPSLNPENGTLAGLSESVTAGKDEAAGGELGMPKDLNKSTCTPSENGLHTACEPESVEIGNFRTVSNQTGVNLSDAVKSDKHENTIDINASSSKGSGPAAESGVVCLYQCCPECVYSLYHLIHKLLVREWGLNRSHRTVEDVYDVVASLSVDLISAVRKCYMDEDFSDLSNKTSRHEKHGTPLDSLNLRTCNMVNQGKDVVPGECVSHSATQHAAAASKDTVLNESLKLDLKFIFRDGVLVPMDMDMMGKDAPLHCKFESLCLCSVIELIAMSKHPF